MSSAAPLHANAPPASPLPTSPLHPSMRSELPLSPEQFGLARSLAEGLDGAGLWWLSGYAAGLAQARAGGVASALPATSAIHDSEVAQRLTIVYGSQTGNAKRLAETLARQSEAEGLAVRLLRADAYPLRELCNERALYLVISTHGDGDPPDDARALVEFITGKRAPEVPALRYAVLGLGDSSYPQFCAIGRALDERLSALGGQRLLGRGDADLDLDTVAQPWLARALDAAKSALRAPTPLASVTTLRPVPATPGWSREQPFAAEVLVNQRITGRGSDRDIRHVELSLQGSNLQYEPGDALGVWPLNPPPLVDAVLQALQLDGDAAVAHGGQTLALRDWLGAKREITRLTRPFLTRHAGLAGSASLGQLLAPDNTAALARLFAQQQLLDVLRATPAAWTADTLVAALRPLTPRLYSIASAQSVVGDEAHLTVAHIEYDRGDGMRWGAASNHLARTVEGEMLPVYIERNQRFRLPADGARDVIMIGPGTGVAPFRGFVQQRAAAGATGRNWLLFGNPHARSDFLYQLEWQAALKRGELHRLDLAFSRDGAADSPAGKTYVQQRLREHGSEVFAWLQAGAHVYVCGDATRMARDVHAALIEVIARHGGHDADGSADYLNDLQAQGRYARDVY